MVDKKAVTTKENMLDKKAVLTREKIKTISLAKKPFWLEKKLK